MSNPFEKISTSSAERDARRFGGIEERLRALEGPSIEDWHEVGASGEPAFESTFTNFGGDWATIGFRKDPFGTVHLKGMATTITNGANVFTLPVGYRPAQDHIINGHTNGGTARFNINNTGPVTLHSGGSSWISLSGITFKAEG